jgi:hypothetical protein
MKYPILAAIAASTLATPAFALFGVGDVVIVASNPAQEMLWATKELPKWIEMINKAQDQVNKAQEMINLVGNPQQFAGKIISSAVPAYTLTDDAVKLASRKAFLDFTRSSWTLYNSSKRLHDSALQVPETYQAFGREVKRDKERYMRLAMEKALYARVQEAVEKKHAVDKKELEFQKDTMAKLQGATTQTEISLHQAALAASRQRMELASARVHQAEQELKVFKGEVELDQSSKREAAKEWAENVVEEAVGEVAKAMERGGGPVIRPIGAANWNSPAP